MNGNNGHGRRRSSAYRGGRSRGRGSRHQPYEPRNGETPREATFRADLEAEGLLEVRHIALDTVALPEGATHVRSYVPELDYSGVDVFARSDVLGPNSFHFIAGPEGAERVLRLARLASQTNVVHGFIAGVDPEAWDGLRNTPGSFLREEVRVQLSEPPEADLVATTTAAQRQSMGPPPPPATTTLVENAAIEGARPPVVPRAAQAASAQPSFTGGLGSRSGNGFGPGQSRRQDGMDPEVEIVAMRRVASSASDQAIAGGMPEAERKALEEAKRRVFAKRNESILRTARLDQRKTTTSGVANSTNASRISSRDAFLARLSGRCRRRADQVAAVDTPGAPNFARVSDTEPRDSLTGPTGSTSLAPVGEAAQNITESPLTRLPQ